MLLSEMVRQIKKEAALYLDTTSYTSPTAHDWTTRKSKTITLSEPSLVFVRFKGYSGGSNAMGSLRLLHNSNPVLVYQHMSFSPGIQQSLLMYLEAGSHTFELQTAVDWSPNSNEVAVITEFYIAVLGFADQGGQEYAPAAVSVSAGATATVASLSFTVPSARKLATGVIKQYACIVTAYCDIPNYRSSEMKNPGEANASSVMNFRLYLDGAEIGWKERQNDDFDSGYNMAYSEGCYGRAYFALTPGSHTLEVKATNNLSSAYNARAVLNLVFSPWFLIDKHEPLTLNFPQGSTLYLVAEPLWQDPTKTIKLGWQRFVSFGDSTDYYSTASGTGVLSWNYTFESVNVASCSLFVGGYGGCISIIAVDVR
jgi:hypothetical protein